jgi:DNA-binding transcriptional LysR family regulator
VRADDLLLLLEVARSGSLSGAAGVLGVNHTTIARRLATLERDLGSPLVTRTVRGCRLTDVGQSLLPSALSIESAVQQANTSGQGTRARHDLQGLVRVSAPDGFGAHFVAPSLARLRERHPGVAVELLSETRPVASGVGADIQIGVGKPQTKQVEPRPLTRYALCMYASPAYLRREGMPTVPSELSRHKLVAYVEGLLRVPELSLLLQLEPTGTIGLSSNSLFAQVEAVCAGGGIVVLPAYIGNRDARLQRVLPDLHFELELYISPVPQQLRRPATMEASREITREVQARRAELLPPNRGQPWSPSSE